MHFNDVFGLKIELAALLETPPPSG
jgi:hypothetical protein